MGLNDTNHEGNKSRLLGQSFYSVKKTFYPKKCFNPMELHISEEKPYLRALKQIMLPTKQISIRNPVWQNYSWVIRKLKNIIQLHKNDLHTNDPEGTEH